MGAQRGPPGTDLSGGPRQGNWEGRDVALQGGSEGRPRHWVREVRRQVRGRLEARKLWGRPQLHPAMRWRLLWVGGRWGLGGMLVVALRRRVPGYHRVEGPWRLPRRSGRGAGRGVTVAQTHAQLASAAAQRDARKAGQTRVAAGGGGRNRRRQ